MIGQAFLYIFIYLIFLMNLILPFGTYKKDLSVALKNILINENKLNF